VKTFISDWRNALPLVGLGAVAVTGLYYFLRPKREDPDAMERERRTYLNRVGRIVEGQVLDVVDGSGVPSQDAHPPLPSLAPAAAKSSADTVVSSGGSTLRSATLSIPSRDGRHEALVANRHGNGSSASGVLPKLLFYTYSISGVTYETAQDITGLEEQLHLDRVAAGQTASVKYDPSNPSNSILLADDWSGLH
jgi:hypothetical protein